MGLWQIFCGVLLSATPLFELRGGIPLMRALGLGVYSSFLLGVASNILIIPVIFFFLDYVHNRLLKFSFYDRMFEKYLNKARGKFNNKFKTWPYFGLWFFVAIPIPTTGVYTAGLISWFFKLNRKKSFISMALGVLCAGIIVSLIYAGIISWFAI